MSEIKETYLVTTEYYCGKLVKSSCSFESYFEACAFLNSCVLCRGYDSVLFKIIRH